jgi:hypothetical protein
MDAMRALHRLIRRRPLRFRSSASYWEARYDRGHNSGAGSYGRLALFKADTINAFVAEHSIESIIEFGCGDGAQLALGQYPRYMGVDASRKAIAVCKKRYATDSSKQFFESIEAGGKRAEMAMSLDVIYHLVEDEVYESYMRRLVNAAHRFVCVYSSNVELPGHAPHIRHRHFSEWMVSNAKDWVQVRHARKRVPIRPPPARRNVVGRLLLL